jgi:histidinol-phosphate aminotransferase
VTVRLRADLADLPRYRPGRVANAAGATGTGYKLSSNENPFPPLPSVLAAVTRAATELNRYPDFGAADLVAAIADHHAVAVERVALSTGSVAVAQALAAAVAGPGDEVMFAWRSFEAYPILTKVAGATPVPIPLRDEHQDLAAMAAAITERTRLIFLCTPNNPTGTALSAAEVASFCDRVPADCLVVLDEAYAEFVTDPTAVDGLRGPADRPNVAVLRTFSKAYGLASLRVGYSISSPAVADAVRAVATPFGVSSLAQAAALASLSAADEMAERVDRIVAERDRLTIGLRDAGYATPDSQANFVWLRLGDATAAFVAACDAAGIAVRGFPGEGVRITVGEPSATDALLTVATSHLRASAAATDPSVGG